MLLSAAREKGALKKKAFMFLAPARGRATVLLVKRFATGVDP